MIRNMAIVIAFVISTSGCSSTPSEPCQPWQACWKKMEQNYILHKRCEAARADAEQRHRTNAVFMDVYIKHGRGMIKCR